MPIGLQPLNTILHVNYMAKYLREFFFTLVKPIEFPVYVWLIFQGTDLQKYLNAVGYSEFEVSKQKPVKKLCPTEVSLKLQC